MDINGLDVRDGRDRSCEKERKAERAQKTTDNSTDAGSLQCLTDNEDDREIGLFLKKSTNSGDALCDVQT